MSAEPSTIMVLREQDGVTIVIPGERLDDGSELVALREEVLRRIDAGTRKLVLNFNEVQRVDSSALGCIISMATYARRAGLDLRIADSSGRLRKLIRLSMRCRFPGLIFDTEEEAVASFHD